MRKTFRVFFTNSDGFLCEDTSQVYSTDSKVWWAHSSSFGTSQFFATPGEAIRWLYRRVNNLDYKELHSWME